MVTIDSSYKTPFCRSSRASASIIAAMALPYRLFTDSGNSADT
jgi:hypothetical protein